MIKETAILWHNRLFSGSIASNVRLRNHRFKTSLAGSNYLVGIMIEIQCAAAASSAIGIPARAETANLCPRVSRTQFNCDMEERPRRFSKAKLFRNCFSGQVRQGSVNHSMITMIHALWEFSPLIAGLVCGSLTSIRNRLEQRALIIKASLVMGTVLACAAGELAGALLTAIVSIIVDAGAVAAGLIVAHVVVKRIAVFRSQLQGR